MNTAIQQITSKLEAEFAEFDTLVENDAVKYVKLRYEALSKAKEEFKDIARQDPWGYYEKLYAAAGGKTIYNLIRYGFNSNVEIAVRKSEQTKAARRNIKIADKLNKAGVVDMTEATIERSVDGFNGVFVVNTNSGHKTVVVNTIFAGGYNIQCAHLRVLVKVK